MVRLRKFSGETGEVLLGGAVEVDPFRGAGLKPGAYNAGRVG